MNQIDSIFWSLSLLFVLSFFLSSSSGQKMTSDWTTLDHKGKK